MVGKPHVAVFMGCVGKDENAKILEDRVTSEGVRVRYQKTEEQPTGKSLCEDRSIFLRNNRVYRVSFQGRVLSLSPTTARAVLSAPISVQPTASLLLTLRIRKIGALWSMPTSSILL